MGICGSGRNGQWSWRMSYKPPTRGGSASQILWLNMLDEMGGQFWPPEPVEEEDMPEVGAKYPMMLYDGARQCIVYDAEERAEATKHGFKPHPSMERDKPPGIVDPPKPPGILDPKPPVEEKPPGPNAPSQGLPSGSPKAPATPVAKQPEKQPEVKTTVSVQKTVEVKKPAAPPPKK
jgi:hypothetical protein